MNRLAGLALAAGALLAAAPAMAQPIIIPLGKQRPADPQPQPSPVPIAPPQAGATPGSEPQAAPNSAPDRSSAPANQGDD